LSDKPDELDDGLDALGAQLRLAAERESEVQRRVRVVTRRSRRRRAALALVAVLVPSVAIAGVNGLFESEKPLPPDRRSSPVRAGLIPSSVTPDPGGLLPWALQLQSRADGQDCLLLGRLRGGELGQIEGGAFRSYPPDAPGLCGDLRHDPILAFATRRPLPQARTVVYGLAPDRAAVTLKLRGQRITQAPHALGAFLFVLRGTRSVHGAQVSTRARGRGVTVRLK
jgi:hypothetical protein